MAALALLGGSEVIYVGMYGAASDGGQSARPCFERDDQSCVEHCAGVAGSDAESGGQRQLSAECFGFDISSIFIDPHDPTGNTVYVTVEGIEPSEASPDWFTARLMAARTGRHLTANLPASPANSLAVDPQNANTVYIATDEGVYFTTQVANCASRSPLLVGLRHGLPGRLLLH